MCECTCLHFKNWTCSHTRSMPACLLPLGFFLPARWRECDKWPLIITKWIELCDGHIRRPQEKCHATHIMWFSSVVMGDKCFLSVHPPSPHPPLREHCLPKLRPRRRGSRDDEMEGSAAESEMKRGMGGKKDKMPLRIALSQEMPTSHILSQRGGRKVKCLLWQRNRLWQREMQTQGGLG